MSSDELGEGGERVPLPDMYTSCASAGAVMVRPPLRHGVRVARFVVAYVVLHLLLAAQHPCLAQCACMRACGALLGMLWGF